MNIRNLEKEMKGQYDLKWKKQSKDKMKEF